MIIGIYTFFRSNYGAVLQAYSLQRTLKEMRPDDEVLMVDFKTAFHRSFEKVFVKKSENKLFNLVWQFLILVHYRQLKLKRDSFREFHKTRFDYTSRYSTQEELLNNPPTLDVHLSGSDQVFNPKNQYRDVFYLRFPKGTSRKVAYAPSFGVSRFSDDDKAYIKEALSDFDSLSCRESNGAEFMTQLMGKDIPHVLDPVFLTSAEEWRKIAVKPRLKQEYVFVYCLKDLKGLVSFAKANYPGRTIVLLSPNHLRPVGGCKQIFYPGPAEFVGLIEQASSVVTDSFHGTAFSIIFQKDFHVLISRPEVSSRIVSLVKMMGLEECIVKRESIVQERPGSNIVDMSYLQQQISFSEDFLRSSVQR